MSREPTRPNIVFVLADAYRSQSLGFAGADPVCTPNLDAFATESVVLTHCVSNLPVARGYLAGSSLPLKRIAAEFGFHDEFHFSRTFRARVGRSPSEYRPMHSGT